MIRRLTKEANVPGVHLCTLNLEKSVQRVIEGLGWTSMNHTLKPSNRLIAVICVRPCSGNAAHSLPSLLRTSQAPTPQRSTDNLTWSSRHIARQTPPQASSPVVLLASSKLERAKSTMRPAGTTSQMAVSVTSRVLHMVIRTRGVPRISQCVFP